MSRSGFGLDVEFPAAYAVTVGLWCVVLLGAVPYLSWRSRTGKSVAYAIAHTLGAFGLSGMLFGVVVYGNVEFDHEPAKAFDLVVTDSFVVRRESNHYEKYVALSTPPGTKGSTRLWTVGFRVSLDDYSPGTVVRVELHPGYFGHSWCEFDDPTISGGPTELKRFVDKAGFAMNQAKGRFAADSKYRALLAAWYVPIEDIGDNVVKGWDAEFSD
ncbi:MAG: hypothetical protein GC159_09355 [Phycisphaera sp.]|nr:hypothetical protein [Phycisphaera sp.]